MRACTTLLGLVGVAVAGVAIDIDKGIAQEYEVVQAVPNDSYNFTAQQLTHKVSGAQLVLLLTPDKEIERTFAISFRTPVDDDTGCAHILEHSVLGGSEGFPLRFVIQNLQAGSAATFINAMTYPDRTTYPIATVNAEDFANLVKVYLDAVFRPLVLTDRDIFDREGWHYHLPSADEPLTYSGIVFNEMKGVYSNSKSLLTRKLIQELMPNSTYKWVSGGLPSAIPTLSYERCKAFYFDHYHSGNTKTFYMGPVAEAEVLLNLLTPYLNAAIETNGMSSSTLPQPPSHLTNSRNVKVYGPPDENPPANSVLFGLRIAETSIEMEERLAFDIISHLIIGTRVSPLYMALEGKKWGTNVLDLGVFDYSQNLLFAAGVSGVPQSVTSDLPDRLRELIMSKFEELAVNGFGSDSIEAAMTMIEFKLREQMGNRVNRGIKFMDVVLDEWTYDRDPFRAIDLLSVFHNLRRQYDRNPSLFSDLISTYVLNNTDTVVVEMVADPHFAAKRAQRERAALEKKKRGMSADELGALVKRTKELEAKAAQPDPPEAVARLPRLPVSAVSRQETPIDTHVRVEDGIVSVSHNLPTAGILYVTLYSDTRDLARDEVQMLPLLNYLLRNGETNSLSRKELSHIIERTFGSLQFNHAFRKASEGPRVVSEPLKGIGFWKVHFRCLMDRAEKCFGLLSEILTNVTFETLEDRAIIWLRNRVAQAENELLSNPSKLGKLRIQSHLSTAGLAAEFVDGLTSIEEGRRLLGRVVADWKNDVSLVLDGLVTKLLCKHRVALDLAGEGYGWEEIHDTVNLQFIQKGLNRGKCPDDIILTSWFEKGHVYQPARWNEDYAQILQDTWKGSVRLDKDPLGGGTRVRSPRDVEEEAIQLEPASLAAELWFRNNELRRRAMSGPNLRAAAEAILVSGSRSVARRALGGPAAVTSTGREGFVIPSMVNYVYMAGKISDPRSEVNYRHSVPARLLSEKYIFPQIRLIGGAYGASFALLARDGIGLFSTYRDPHVGKSIRRMERAAEEYRRLYDSISQVDVDNEIVHLVSQLDSPSSHDTKAATAFMRWAMRETPKDRNWMREEIILTNMEDVKTFILRLNRMLNQQNSVSWRMTQRTREEEEEEEDEKEEKAASLFLVVLGAEDKIRNVTYRGKPLSLISPLLA